LTRPRAGQKYGARSFLRHVVAGDRDNAHAWLWLAGVERDLDKRRYCLKRVLALDPENEAAQRGLPLVERELADQLIRRRCSPARLCSTLIEPTVGSGSAV